MSPARRKLDIDVTQDRLNALGLSHAGGILGQVLTNAVSEETLTHAFLDKLLGVELGRREERRIRSTEAVLLLGPPGVGKSHLCVAPGIKAVQLGFSAQYCGLDELMTAFKDDAALPPICLKRKKYMSTALLMIDEMGYDPTTRDEAMLFFRPVSYRYSRRAMMMTTNKAIRY